MVTDWSGGLMHTAWQASDMTLVVKLLVSSMSSGIEASHPATECMFHSEGTACTRDISQLPSITQVCL